MNPPTTTTLTPAALTLCLLCAIAIAAGCGKPEQAKADPSSVVKSSFIDARDGKEYRTVKIGKQVWMAENLNFVADSSWCYDNDDANCEKYGRLYDWDAAMGACPAGWRLPIRKDWDELAQLAGGRRMRDKERDYYWSKAGRKLKSTTGWNNVYGNGTDDFAFSALPGGYRNISISVKSKFAEAGNLGHWWSATEMDNGLAHLRYMLLDVVYEDYHDKAHGSSVRCVND